jgi:hypothetical protein
MSESGSNFTREPSRAMTAAITAARGDGARGFDVDAYHVIEGRDDELIKNEVLYGTGSSKFVYSFDIGGTTVSGISVVGARALASHYGALKHRLVASVSKNGALFTFTSYPGPGQPMFVDVQRIPALADDDDYYEVIVEVADIKTGNQVQVRKREARRERRRDGTYFERPHYSVIAEAKAYRNAVLSLVDQAVQLEWKQEMLKLRKDEVITGSIVDEKRTAVLRFAASKAITIDRRKLEALTMDQLAGLGDAARAGGVEEFRKAADAALVTVTTNVVTQQGPAAPAADKAASPAAAKAAKPAPSVESKPPAYEELIADEDGAMLQDEAGNDQVFTTAAGYLGALGRMAHASDRLAVLLEANADGIEKARTADPKAAVEFDATIAGLLKPRQVSAPAGEQASVPAAGANDPAQARVISMPMKGGRPDTNVYLTACRTALEAIQNDPALAAWHAANVKIAMTLPTVAQKSWNAAVAARAEAIRQAAEASFPGSAQAEDAQPAGPLDEPDAPAEDTELSRLIAEVDAAPSLEALTALNNAPDFGRRFGTLSADEQMQIRNRASVRRRALATPTE